MTDASPPPPPPPAPAPAVAAAAPADEQSPTAKRIELIAAILLGLAGLLAAWAAFQADALGDEATQAFNLSNQQLTDANFFYSQGNQRITSDTELFVTYAVAVTEGNQPLADFVRGTLMDENLTAAVAWWETTDAALTPFDEGTPYVVADYAEADELQASAEANLTAALEAEGQADSYDLASVVLAVSLFFAGIAIVFDRPGLSFALLAFSSATIIWGAVLVFTA